MTIQSVFYPFGTLANRNFLGKNLNYVQSIIDISMSIVVRKSNVYSLSFLRIRFRAVNELKLEMIVIQ